MWIYRGYITVEGLIFKFLLFFHCTIISVNLLVVYVLGSLMQQYSFFSLSLFFKFLGSQIELKIKVYTFRFFPLNLKVIYLSFLNNKIVMNFCGGDKGKT